MCMQVPWQTPEETLPSGLTGTLLRYLLCCAVLCCAVLCCAVLCCAKPWQISEETPASELTGMLLRYTHPAAYAALCGAVLCCALLCCTTLCTEPLRTVHTYLYMCVSVFVCVWVCMAVCLYSCLFAVCLDSCSRIGLSATLSQLFALFSRCTSSLPLRCKPLPTVLSKFDE